MRWRRSRSWRAALSTADLQEGPEPLSLHCHQEVVWRQQSSREGRQRAKEHLWPSVSAPCTSAARCFTVGTLLTSSLPSCHRYPPEAPELQIRKMADLCFLVQHYELAYSCYHTAKKDFLSDQAMLYAAGALVGAREGRRQQAASVGAVQPKATPSSES